MSDDPRVLGPDGEQLGVFIDGTVEVLTEENDLHVIEFEDAGQEMELELDGERVDTVTINMENATIAPSREVIENERQ